MEGKKRSKYEDFFDSKLNGSEAFCRELHTLLFCYGKSYKVILLFCDCTYSGAQIFSSSYL